VFWSDIGDLCCITTEDSFFILKYDQAKVDEAKEDPELVTEDGITDVFSSDIDEFEESVRTGLWVGHCFIYTNSVNRLNYYVGGEIVTVAHLDRTLYILGYIRNDNRLYLGDKELNIVSYSILKSVLDYQTAVMRQDFETADDVLPLIPKEQRTRVAHFLEKQGFKPQALEVTADPEHKFELALSLSKLEVAYKLAEESQTEQKWKQLADLATRKCQFGLAQECLSKARDFGGLLLLATSTGNGPMIENLATNAASEGKFNVAFMSNFIRGDKMNCLKILIEAGRLPEAAFFARTYAPSQMSNIVAQWKQQLSETNQKAADSLADPVKYDNLFTDMGKSLLVEKYLDATTKVHPASEYPNQVRPEKRNVQKEMIEFEEKTQAEEDKETDPVPSPSPPAVEPLLVQVDEDPKDQNEDSTNEASKDQIEDQIKDQTSSTDLPEDQTSSNDLPEDQKSSNDLPEDADQEETSNAEDFDDLELEIENLEIDDIDTTDVNLDELDDQFPTDD